MEGRAACGRPENGPGVAPASGPGSPGKAGVAEAAGEPRVRRGSSRGRRAPAVPPAQEGPPAGPDPPRGHAGSIEIRERPASSASSF